MAEKYENFWKEVKRIRKEQKIKQADIAKELGISQVSYSDLENGKTELTMERAMKIIRYLKMENPLIPVKDEKEGRLDEMLPTLIQQSPLLKEFFKLHSQQLKQNINIQQQQLLILTQLLNEGNN